MASSERQIMDRELQKLRREQANQAAERERLLQEMRIMEVDRERQIQELVAKHEEQVRQAYAFAAQSTPRMGPQHIDRAQSGSSEDDGELANIETVSRASITDSVCRPRQYRR